MKPGNTPSQVCMAVTGQHGIRQLSEDHGWRSRSGAQARVSATCILAGELFLDQAASNIDYNSRDDGKCRPL
jgi:hypothetical protein